MKSNYVIWAHKAINGQCKLVGMKGFPEDWKLQHGKPVADVFPPSVNFSMNPDDPTGVFLTDSLRNIDRLIVASPRLRSLFESNEVQRLEFLQVQVLNHKKRPIDEPYVIVHPTELVDCLVVDACEPRWGAIDPDSINDLMHLVIDESRIPANRLLFRPKLYTKVILVQRNLAEQITAAGLTGVRWIELSNWPED